MQKINEYEAPKKTLKLQKNSKKIVSDLEHSQEQVSVDPNSTPLLSQRIHPKIQDEIPQTSSELNLKSNTALSCIRETLKLSLNIRIINGVDSTRDPDSTNFHNLF